MRRAVGQRVGERHADLEAVGAGVERRFGQRVAGGHVREAGRQIREQRAAALGARQPLERCGANAASRQVLLRAAGGVATVWMSLSPRPESVTSVMPGCGLARTQARAWAGSSAGMMPSLRVSRKNASSASASPIDA